MAVGLVKIAVVAAVIALKKAFLDSLHCQIKSEILAVYRDIGKAAKGRAYAEIPHKGIAQEILHIGVILNNVVKAQLVEAVVCVGRIVVVKLYFKAVSVVSVIFDVCKGGVSLGAQSDIFLGLSVDNHGTEGVFLVCAGFKKAVKIVHNNVHCVDLCVVEKTCLVARRPCREGNTQLLSQCKDRR